MYKELLDILMEDINDHNNIKETILKNQLKYHFTDKSANNKDTIDKTTVLVRRIIDRFPLNNIIGVQPITDKENPTITSGGLNYDVEVVNRNFSAAWIDATQEDLKDKYGISVEAEMLQALAAEIETELVGEFLHLIGTYAKPINVDVKGFEDAQGVTDTITAAIIDAHANWIVVPALILAMLQSDKHSKYEQHKEGQFNMGEIMQAGKMTVDGKEVKVYCSLWGLGDTILVGSKDADSEDTPIVYAPDVMLVCGGKVQHPHTKEEFESLKTKYARFIHHHDCQEQYRRIIINFLNNG